MAILINPISCPDCGIERYCTKECMANARLKYHSSVCGIDTIALKKNSRNGISALMIFRIFAHTLNAGYSDVFSLDWFGQLSGWKDRIKIPSNFYY